MGSLKRTPLKAKTGFKNTQKSLKSMTSKRKKVEDNYRNQKIDKVDLEGACCTGCGVHDRLSLSHLVPRSRRPDLIDEPLNHRIHCMDGIGIVGCHTKWESKRWEELKDGEECLELVKQLDPEYYLLITMKKQC